MLRAALTWSVLVVLLACAPACGGLVVFVEDDDGQGGSGGAPSTGPGKSSSVITVGTTSVTSTSQGPQTSVVATATTGPKDCTTCNELISGEDNGDPFCPGSERLYFDFVSCVCKEQCAMECFRVCQGGSDFPPDCEDCIFGPCGPALDACLNDF
jgi:hypothetical protein